MRALVCGGAGFIGSHLVDRLVRDRHQVTVIDDFSHGQLDNLDQAMSTGALTVVPLDVTGPGLAAAVREAAPDAVFHLAAQVNVRTSVAEPVRDAATNVVGTVAVLEAARRAGVRKVLLASSVTIYGSPPALPVTEATPARPLSPYAASKLAGECYLRQYRDLYGLDTTTLALSNTYGPRQDPYGESGAITIFADLMLSGRPTCVFGTGSNTRDYLYVTDVVDAFVRAAVAPGLAGRRLNLGTGVATSDLELNRCVARAVGGAPEPERGPARLGDLPHMRVDASAARRALGWAPVTSLADGLAATVAARRAARLTPVR